MFCTTCGTPVPDDAQFCTTCGASLATPAPAETHDAPNYPTWQNNAAASYPQSAPVGKKSPTVAIAAGVAIGIIVVAIAVIAILFGTGVLGGNNSQPAQDQQQAEPTSESAASNASPAALDLHISQVDNSAFPTVTLYTSILRDGLQFTQPVDTTLLTLTEFDSKGTSYLGTIDSIAPLAVNDAMNINLVLDQSGSMNSGGKMASAKAAADTFVDEITSTANNVAEITAFDSYVYNVQPFTSDAALLKSAVGSLAPDGETALYDALFWALQRTNLRDGSRVVIAFTDGDENNSYYSQSEVVELSRMTGIPVYIVGIGDSINRSELQTLATQCNGWYFDASATNLQTALSDIYDQIYFDQRALYRIVYTSTYTGDKSSYRTVHIACADGSGYTGETETSYMPVDNVSSFETYVNAHDYVLPDSGSRYYSRAELERLSLWELYLARNEIFARYGRGFKNQDLVEYFATKRWYHQTATPEEFDANPSPLNDYEQKNTVAMLEIEKERNSPYITQNRQQ